MARLKWNEVLIPKSAANAPIKNTASPEAKDGWYPAFSATGQDVWLPDYKFEGSGIVVSAVGAHCGKSFKAEGKWNVVANTHALMVNEEIATRDYCWYILNNEEWWIRAGAGQPFVKLKDSLIREHDFPPICEQNKITYILDCVSTLIDARKQQVLKLDELVKSRFIEMFGGDKYPRMQVQSLCADIVDCPHTTPKYNGVLCNPAIRTSEIKKGFISWDTMRYVSDDEYEERTARLKPEAGDIVYGREGTFGNAAVLPQGHKFCLGQRVMLLRPDYTKCTSEYLLYAVISDDVYQQALEKNNASTVAHVNVADVKRFIIPLPPINLQNKFATFVEQTDKLKFEIKEALEKLETLKKSLMQQYFG